MGQCTNILILGGTREAAQLASLLAKKERFRSITSLAGKTSDPAKIPGETRIGGFGGVEGLVEYLKGQHIGALVDATHPFASNMRLNAQKAAEKSAIPLLRLERPAWQPREGDHWHRVSSLGEAAAQIPKLGTRIFLTVGSNDLRHFKNVAEVSFFARMIEKPAESCIPKGCKILLERPPYDLAHETSLLSSLEIDLLVTKNSGGEMVAAKLEAARQKGIQVLMIERPTPPSEQHFVTCASKALGWLEAQLDCRTGH